MHPNAVRLCDRTLGKITLPQLPDKTLSPEGAVIWMNNLDFDATNAMGESVRLLTPAHAEVFWSQYEAQRQGAV